MRDKPEIKDGVTYIDGVPQGICRQCKYEGGIYKDGLCYQCYIDRGSPDQKELESRIGKW